MSAMTIYLCSVCGTPHRSDEPGCARTFTLTLPASNDPKVVGLVIRGLLMAMHREGHTLDDERGGIFSHGTDELRRQALSIAGVCSLDSGEMAPGCACGWTAETGIVRPTKENPHP